VPLSTQVILSSHDFQGTPAGDELMQRSVAMRAAGADVVKIAVMAQDICDCSQVLRLLREQTGGVGQALYFRTAGDKGSG
jgi:3-dehydroquinate dehydratase type I